jgi:hypothetical protein
MEIRLLVDTGNGPRELATTMWAIVQWERKFKVKASDMAKSMGMEDLTFLAYCSEQAAGNSVPAVFDDYVKRIKSLDVLESEESATPTLGALSEEN